MKATRRESTKNRHRRIRRRVIGTPERPRLAVFRSNNHIYAQIIDDSAHHTLVSASTLEPDLRTVASESNPCDASVKVGELVAKRALEKGIQRVVFDRGGNLYHGRIKALADGARQVGLEF